MTFKEFLLLSQCLKSLVISKAHWLFLSIVIIAIIVIIVIVTIIIYWKHT